MHWVLHHRKPTCPPKRSHFKRKVLFQPLFFRVFGGVYTTPIYWLILALSPLLNHPNFTIDFDYFWDSLPKLCRSYMGCSYLTIWNNIGKFLVGLDFKTMKFPRWHGEYGGIMASQPTPPPNVPHHRNKGLIRPYQGKPIVSKPFILRTCFWFFGTPGQICMAERNGTPQAEPGSNKSISWRLWGCNSPRNRALIRS